MRQRILYFAIKYEGNYDKINKAIINNEKSYNIAYKGKYITQYDEEYPKVLHDLHKPPYILFYKGDIALINKLSISIVGSRKSSSYGEECTEYLVKSMSKNFVIVSGLASGIDAHAHWNTCKYKGKTIAVLGCGIDFIYPYKNRELYNCLINSHLVISEYPGIIKPKPYFFPFRNRIVAALGSELYVMQASLRSGTMTTVNEALEINRDVYVLPYRLGESIGEGCNYLIEQGANLITNDHIK